MDSQPFRAGIRQEMLSPRGNLLYNGQAIRNQDFPNPIIWIILV